MAIPSSREAHTRTIPTVDDPESDAAPDAQAEPNSPRATSETPRGQQLWSRRATKVVAWLMSLGVATASTWLLTGRHNGHEEDTGLPSAAAGAPQEPIPNQTLVDTADGYRLSFPATWTELPAGDAQAGEGGHVIRIGGQTAMSIRTFPLEHSVATAGVDDMRAVTDAILSAPKAHLTVIDVRQTEIAGLPAIYYLYYFPSGTERGVHAHYFIFDGANMHTLIFQVVPETDFAKYADQFDQVVASFQRLTS